MCGGGRGGGIFKVVGVGISCVGVSRYHLILLVSMVFLDLCLVVEWGLRDEWVVG